MTFDINNLEKTFRFGQVQNDNGKRISVITPVYRASFSKIDEPTQYMGQGAFRFTQSLIFNTEHPDEPAHVDLEKILFPALRKCAAANGVNLKAPDANPFETGDKFNSEGEAISGYGDGYTYCTASKYPKKVESSVIQIFDARSKPADASIIYDGCYARALIQMYRPKKWKKISIGLGWVQFVDDGEPFGDGDVEYDAPDCIPGADTVKSAPVGGYEDF